LENIRQATQMAISQPYRIDRNQKSASDRLLMALKMRGPQSSAVLGAQLRITGEAARQQLLRLEEQGLVVSRPEIRGVGRPVAVWHLTDAAEARFPDAHAQLTVDLLGSIRSELGQSAVDTIIGARERDTKAIYKQAMAGLPTLPERIGKLAEIRSSEGYMAEWSALADGSYVLAENHCPICAAAATCQDFCRAEINVFREVLGADVQVEREEHIIQGARRCAYRITPNPTGNT
jgi:predicted ArsR family transcriptional regulator